MILPDNLIKAVRTEISVYRCVHVIFSVNYSIKKQLSFESFTEMKEADLRHIRGPAYRCFLPDLTRFTGSYCAGPQTYGKAIKRQLLE